MYKIYKRHLASTKRDLVLSTYDLQDILKFFNGANDNGIFGYEIRLVDFEQALKEYMELIEGNYMFETTFKEYINNEQGENCSVIIAEEIEDYARYNKIMVQGIIWNNGEREGYLVKNNEENIAQAIKWISNELFQDYVMEIESEEN